MRDLEVSFVWPSVHVVSLVTWKICELSTSILVCGHIYVQKSFLLKIGWGPCSCCLLESLKNHLQIGNLMIFKIYTNITWNSSNFYINATRKQKWHHWNEMRWCLLSVTGVTSFIGNSCRQAWSVSVWLAWRNVCLFFVTTSALWAAVLGSVRLISLN